MTFAKKVFIPIEISQESENHLINLKDLAFLKDAEIHFIHLFQTMTYAFGIAEAPLSFPVDGEREEIERAGIDLMKSIGQKVLPHDFQGKVDYELRFSDDPKRCFVRLVKNESPDLVIIPCRVKHGVFESSFAKFVSSQTSCHLLLLKH